MQPFRRCLSVVVAAALGAACADSDADPVDTIPELIDQATAADRSDPKGAGLPGLWRTRATVEVPGGPTAHVDLIWIIGQRDAWHVVEVFADPGLTIPLLRWDIVRGYALGRQAPISQRAVELDWTDRAGFIEVFVDDPATLAALGVDDCGAAPGEPRDTSGDDCAAPFFPFRDCTLMDFAELAGGRLTFGDPRATDRCTERASTYEAWTFDRVPMTAELDAILDARPTDLL